VASSAPARTVRPQRAPRRNASLAFLLSLGAVCGLAWAASLRGFMAQVAGAESGVSWSGTFGWILTPGVVTGLLLAWAEYIRRTGPARLAVAGPRLTHLRRRAAAWTARPGHDV
jgi:hypothetical protein